MVLNNLNVSNTGLYKLNGNTSNCPILGDSIYLQVNLNPIIDINANPTEICPNESSELTVSSDISGTTFNWSYDLGTNPIVTVNPTETTTYSVTCTTPRRMHRYSRSYSYCSSFTNELTATANPEDICLGDTF